MHQQSRVISACAGSLILLAMIVRGSAARSPAPDAEFIGCTWQGANNGVWSNAGNWSCNAVPNNGGGNTYDVTLGNNTVVLDQTATINSFSQNAGTLKWGNGVIVLTITQQATWSAFTLNPKRCPIQGQGQLCHMKTTGPLAIGPSAGEFGCLLREGTLRIEAPATLSGTTLWGDKRGVIFTTSSFMVTDNSDLKIPEGGEAVFYVENGGSFRKTGGNGVTDVEWDLDNFDGTIDVANGTLACRKLYQSKGTLRVARDAVLSSPNDLVLVSGLVTGAGTISGRNVIGNKIRIKGDVTPDKLVILATVEMGEMLPMFDSSVGGPGPYPDYNSQVQIAGDCALGGQLRVEVWPGYTPPMGHEFILIIVDGRMSGQFVNVLDGQRMNTVDGAGSFLVRYGSAGFEHKVSLVDWGPQVPYDTTPVACCFVDGTCQLLNPLQCLAQFGVSRGPGTNCLNADCPQPTGACCLGFNCQVLTAAQCAALRGEYAGNETNCNLNLCPTPPCPADTNYDIVVNIDDLLAVITGWGPCPPVPASCPGDVAPSGGNGIINVDDLLAIITGWGPC